jgi:hypothetical protein
MQTAAQSLQMQWHLILCRTVINPAAAAAAAMEPAAAATAAK